MRKIAMFVGEISAGYQQKICDALSEECKKDSIQLTVFHNFAAYGTNVFHSYGERSVMRIPNLKQYDGFVLASDAFEVEGMREELTALLQREAESPIICLREEDERFYNILVDDYDSMSRMVEHFITEHGLTKICFMKGREDLRDAQIRFQAYLDVMHRHHLKVTEHMVFNGDYWKLKGEQAVSWLWDTAEEKPQAIVCANDYMAISVQDALQARGVRIPEDVRVSGFDDCEEARFYVPAISSMYVDGEQMAKTAVGMFMNIWGGRPQKRVEIVSAEGHFRESCGCRQEGDSREQHRLFQAKEYLQTAVNQAAFMHVDCENSNSMEDLARLGTQYFQYEDKHTKIYLCFCNEEEKRTEKAEMAGKYTEYMELYAIMQAGNTVFCKERFRRETILPESFLEDGETMYVNPLHDQNDCLGYFVVVPGFSEEMRYFYQLWVQAITNSIRKQKMYNESKQMTETLDKYNLDELTGIPNRRKLDFVLKNADTQLRLEGKAYFVASVDMDGLKYINDNFGHVVGDDALCVLAGILSRGVGEAGIVARTGGDEFIICYRTDDDKLVESQLQKIREAIEEYNRTSDKKYDLSASIGYAKCVKGMMPINCIQQADEMMYREKRKKKGNVRAE